MDYRYNAFISYRHSELDMYVAKKVHKGLETFKVPAAVTKATGIKKIQRVFRDQEELPIGSDLNDNITEAIKSTEFLIVICSPRTPQSEWVQKEIESFISYHGREKILAVLVEGEPGESFPQALLVDDKGNPVEPLAADVRGMNNKEINKKLKTELLRLAAPILHCTYDDLRQRHRERRTRKIFAITAGILAVAAVLGIGFGIYYANNARVLKQALDDREISHSEFLAAQSGAVLKLGDREAAMLIAREALPYADSNKPFVPSAQYSLSKSLYSYDIGKYFKIDRSFETDYHISEAAYDESGKYLTAIDDGDNVTVWDVESGKMIVSIKGSSFDIANEFSPEKANVIDEKLIVVGYTGIYSFDFDGNMVNSDKLDSYGSFGTINVVSKIAAFENGDSLYFYRLPELERAKVVSKEGNNYFSEYQVSRDGKYLAVSLLSPEDSKQGRVEIFDLENFSSTVIDDVAANYVVAMKFVDKNDLAVVSRSDYAFLGEGEDKAYYVQAFDHNGHKEKWQKRIEALTALYATNDVAVYGRAYEATEGGAFVEHNEVLVTANNSIYTFDGNNGNLVVETGLINVSDLLLGASSGYGYVVQTTGDILMANLSTGEVFNNYTIDTDLYISKALYANQRFAVYSTSDCNIVTLSFHEGVGMETAVFVEDDIAEVEESTDGSLICVRSFAGELAFINPKDLSLVASTTLDSYIKEAAFIDEKTYLAITNDGEAIFINGKDGSSKVVKDDGDFGFLSYSQIDVQNGKALMASNRRFAIIDIKSQEIDYSCETEKTVFELSADLNQMKVYFYNSDCEFMVFDIKEGKNEKIDIPKLAKTDKSQFMKLKVSQDGKYLAVYCNDNMIRVVNTSSMEIECEIPQMSRMSLDMMFSEDNKRLYYEGDDKYLKIYDLQEKDVVFSSSKQFRNLMKIEEVDDMLIVYTINDMTIIDMNTLDFIDDADEARLVDTKNGYVWVSDYETLYRFKFMDLEALYEESERQFPEAELTSNKRIMYFVD